MTGMDPQRLTTWAGVLAIVAAGLGGAYGVYRWQEARPSTRNFSQALRTIEAHSARAADALGERGAAVPCIALPTSPPADSAYVQGNPMGWRLDFVNDPANANPKRATQLQQLDALAAVGLLSQTQVAINHQGRVQAGQRYRLTDEGWKAAGYDRRACLRYGTPRFLQVTSYARAPRHDKLPDFGIYAVRYRSGFGSDAGIASWALDPRVQAAFPQIVHNLAPRDQVALLVRKDGQWMPYEALARDLQQSAMRAQMGARSPTDAKRFDGLVADNQRLMAEEAALPAPSAADITTWLMTRYGPGNQWPNACIELPGASKLPVDRDLSKPGNGKQRGHYAVAIFPTRQRTAWDPVPKKTLPYLALLEQLGVVVKRQAQVQGPRESGLGDADVYELAPAFVGATAQRFPHCLPLGDATVKIVDLQIDNDSALPAYPKTSFRYKLKLDYRDPPAWAKDITLQSRWPELQGALTQGRACDGEFRFDRKKRDSVGGIGSCWWAFDSLAN